MASEIASDVHSTAETVNAASKLGDAWRWKIAAPSTCGHGSTIQTYFSILATADLGQKERRRVIHRRGANGDRRCDQVCFLDGCTPHDIDGIPFREADTAIALFNQRAGLIIGVDKDTSTCDVKRCLTMHPERQFVGTVAGGRQADQREPVQERFDLSRLGAGGCLRSIRNQLPAD